MSYAEVHTARRRYSAEHTDGTLAHLQRPTTASVAARRNSGGDELVADPIIEVRPRRPLVPPSLDDDDDDDQDDEGQEDVDMIEEEVVPTHAEEAFGDHDDEEDEDEPRLSSMRPSQRTSQRPSLEGVESLGSVSDVSIAEEDDEPSQAFTPTPAVQDTAKRRPGLLALIETLPAELAYPGLREVLRQAHLPNSVEDCDNVWFELVGESAAPYVTREHLFAVLLQRGGHCGLSDDADGAPIVPGALLADTFDTESEAEPAGGPVLRGRRKSDTEQLRDALTAAPPPPPGHTPGTPPLDTPPAEADGDVSGSDGSVEFDEAETSRLTVDDDAPDVSAVPAEEPHLSEDDAARDAAPRSHTEEARRHVDGLMAADRRHGSQQPSSHGLASSVNSHIRSSRNVSPSRGVRGYSPQGSPARKPMRVGAAKTVYGPAFSMPTDSAQFSPRRRHMSPTALQRSTEDLYHRGTRAMEKRKVLTRERTAQKAEAEVAGCTFQPQLCQRSMAMASDRRSVADRNTSPRRFDTTTESWLHRGSRGNSPRRDGRSASVASEPPLDPECTFRPEVHDYVPFGRPRSTPTGFYETIGRMRYARSPRTRDFSTTLRGDPPSRRPSYSDPSELLEHRDEAIATLAESLDRRPSQVRVEPLAPGSRLPSSRQEQARPLVTAGGVSFDPRCTTPKRAARELAEGRRIAPEAQRAVRDALATVSDTALREQYDLHKLRQQTPRSSRTQSPLPRYAHPRKQFTLIDAPRQWR